VELPEMSGKHEAIETVREAVRTCCLEECFRVAVEHVRSSVRESTIDIAIMMLAQVSRVSSSGGPRFQQEIMRRFFEAADHSRFGLMNAVTSVARDTRDPRVKWRLEKLGGAIAVARPVAPCPDGARAESALQVM
jgi:hypothetical protein